MRVDLYELNIEITGISMILNGLSNQLDNTLSDTLTPQAMSIALCSISHYLDRIADDLLVIDDENVKKEGAVS